MLLFTLLDGKVHKYRVLLIFIKMKTLDCILSDVPAFPKCKGQHYLEKDWHLAMIF